ncbi:MAG: hypothetical protein JXB10_17780 [Pirellulales bacterium]|nr:hypothetical protein [Pirellulales bacterium]
MDLWFSAVVSGMLLLVSGGLILGHLRQWRRVRPELITQDEYDYRRRRHRRRMQTSVMLGLAGAAFFVGELLPRWIDSDLFFLLYWAAVLLLILWVVLLAAADIWATKAYYGRIRNAYFHEKLKIEAELRRAQSPRSNGKPNKPK